MNSTHILTPIAHIESPFPEKFGIPRQSGLIGEIKSTIVFEPDFRISEALNGIRDYSHLWLIWGFSQTTRKDWTATVRPPRLGGNQRVGVFATRSPFRPNGLGLSCVRLEAVELDTKNGPVLHIAGADLLDGTPIYDIKPYLSYVDSHPDAQDGFASEVKDYELTVCCPDEYLLRMPEADRSAVCALLSQDPRPSYQNDPQRVYGMRYRNMNIRFRVVDNTLTVCDVEWNQ